MYVAVRQLKHYSWAALLTATAVGCLVWAQPHANLTTTALVLVLVVTVSAIAWGSGPALITALLDAVTHDLRTPLTSIKASVTTLLTAMGNNDGADSSLSAEGSRELLDVINEESDSLNHFVEEMMTLAQLEGGQLLLRRSEMP